MDRSIISKFTKLRISNHRFEVDVGRYSKIPPYLRLCKTCNLSVVEDEFRFICVCNAYSDLRKQLFNGVSNKVTKFNTLSLYDKFLFIMASSEIDIISFIVFLMLIHVLIFEWDFMFVINPPVPNVVYGVLTSLVCGVSRHFWARSGAVEHGVSSGSTMLAYRKFCWD